MWLRGLNHSSLPCYILSSALVFKTTMFYLSMYPWSNVVAVAVIVVVVLGHVTLAVSGRLHSTHKSMHMQDSRFPLINRRHSCGSWKVLQVSFLIPVQLPGYSGWPDMFLNHKFKNPVLIIMLMSFYIVTHLE